jgi:O-antigen biosynthesis protein
MMLAGENTSELYGEEYYRVGCGPMPYERSEHWINFFAIVADEIVRSLHPRRVLDAGCAMGFLVEALWDRGIYCEGIDISDYAISQVRRDVREYCSVGSIADRTFDKFDLVTCIEVLEHLPPDEAKQAVGNLCAASDIILFSSTPSDFNEPTHLNVRPPIYWLQLFSESGFFPDAQFDATFIAPHAMLFKKGPPPEGDFLRLFSEYVRYKSAYHLHLGATREMTGLQQELADAAARRQQIEGENTMLIARTAELEAHLGSTRDEMSRSQDWAMSLQAEVARIESARQELIHRLQTKDTDVRMLQDRLVADVEALELRLASSNAERDRVRTDIDNRERDRAAVQATLDAVLSSRAWRIANQLRRPIVKLRRNWPNLYRVVRLAGRKLVGSGTAPEPETAQAAAVPDNTANKEAHLDEGEPDSNQSRTTRVIATPESRQPQAAIDPAYQRWIDEHEPRPEDLLHQREVAKGFARHPVFSIIVPVYRVDHALLRECINSVREQTYDNWELCLAHAPTGDLRNLEYLRGIARTDNRVKLLELDENRGISGNSNAAIDLATGEFLAFLDHDDTLASFALFEMASRVQQWPDLDLLYSDHDYLDPEHGIRCDPLFKPAWSPDIMLSANYITHFTAMRRALANELGRFDPATDGAQDWDLFLRATERTYRIYHCPSILYHWRMHPGSTAKNESAKNYAADAQLLTLARHFDRVGLEASAEIMPDGLLHTRFRRPPQGMVSIIIPTKDRVDLLSRCISSLLQITEYPNFEILIVDNESCQPETRSYLQNLESDERIRIIWFPGEFNYSVVNNTAARSARGEFLLFLNNDVEITSPQWLLELACWANYAPVGIVGGKLLRANGAIQHAGVVVGMNGFADHPFADQPPLTFGMAGSTGWYRNPLAVTGACMMMRRDVFDRLGGFDEGFILCGSDVEICMRAWQRCYRVVYNPFAELIHYEQQTRGCDVPPRDFVESLKHYGSWLLAGDPFWNPNLSLWSRTPTFRYLGETNSFRFAVKHAQAAEKTARAGAAAAPPTEEASLVSWFDCSNEQFAFLRSSANQLSGFRPVKRLLWFIPAFENPFYGGIFTILRFAEYWHSQKSVQNLFAICGSTEREQAAARIRLLYPDLRDSDVFILSHGNAAAALPAVDASICTLWTTPYYAVHHTAVARRFYLIQDFEPAFYKAGSASAVVESTYRMGLYGIANTISLKKTYENEYGGKAIHFTPCVDDKVFYPSDDRSRRNPLGPWVVFFYGRPGHARNCFELLSAAMKQLKQWLGERVRIVSAGSEWNPVDYGLHGIVENLGTLAFEDSARLYRECDIGVVMMLTRHPSYIPLELMASGCLVVSNLNSWTSWLLKDRENCLLTCATAVSVAETVRMGLLDTRLRQKLTETALELIRAQYLDWPSQMDNVYSYLCDPEGCLERSYNRCTT